ncbi:MAG: ribonuclease T2 [Sphingobium sp.]
MIAVAWAAIPAMASAQALSCALPVVTPVPRTTAADSAEPARKTPVAAHTLALSWSPQHCRARQDGRSESFQCAGQSRFGFVLHGLWPDGAGSQWPQYCRRAGVVPPRVVRSMLCTTPSADLMQHEWAKHGTCGWSDPAAYFTTARTLFEDIRYPDMVALSRRPDLTVGALRARFAQANRHIPGLTAEAVRVRVGNGGWLEELWLCLDRSLAYDRCRSGQRGGAPAGQRVRIWRGRGIAPRD